MLYRPCLLCSRHLKYRVQAVQGTGPVNYAPQAEAPEARPHVPEVPPRLPVKSAPSKCVPERGAAHSLALALTPHSFTLFQLGGSGRMAPSPLVGP